MDIKKYITKLQSLTDKQKKIILWAIVGVLAIIMGYFWIRSAGERLNKISENLGQINLPQIEAPQINTPNITDQTADWKTYTNTEYSFEIKYPDDFKKEYIIGPIKTDFGENFFFLENSKGYHLEPSFLYQFKNLVQDQDYITYRKSEILVDGIKSYKQQGLSCHLTCRYENTAFIPYKNGAIVILIEKRGTSESENKLLFADENGDIAENPQITKEEDALFEQMISTFKFTK